MHSPDPHDPDRELDALMQDKLETHCRQQLSAMLDGVLAPDEARFLLRRLQHDGELAGHWERWQVYGEMMRGGVSQLLPADFSQRVVAALETEAQQPRSAVAVRGARPGWTRWAGAAALAASVAMAALFVVQRDPQGAAPAMGSEPRQVAASGAPASVALPDATLASAAQAPVPATPSGLADAAAAGAVILAAREVPRRATRRQGANRVAATAPEIRSATVTTTVTASAPAPQLVEAIASTAAETGAARAASDPFMPEVPASTRPWPRAVVPGMGQGGFTVGYGVAAGRQADAGGFEHFQPRLPAAEDPQAARLAVPENSGDR